MALATARQHRESPSPAANRDEYLALVVDDEAVVRQLTMRALAREGFRCDAACSGKDARQWLSSKRYDIVVSDLRMPVENGHTLTLHVLEMADRPAIVNLTAVSEPRVESFLKHHGVDQVYFKPVDYTDFAKEIRGLVERRATVGQPMVQMLGDTGHVAILGSNQDSQELAKSQDEKGRLVTNPPDEPSNGANESDAKGFPSTTQPAGPVIQLLETPQGAPSVVPEPDANSTRPEASMVQLSETPQEEPSAAPEPDVNSAPPAAPVIQLSETLQEGPTIVPEPEQSIPLVEDTDEPGVAQCSTNDCSAAPAKVAHTSGLDSEDHRMDRLDPLEVDTARCRKRNNLQRIRTWLIAVVAGLVVLFICVRLDQLAERQDALAAIQRLGARADLLEDGGTRVLFQGDAAAAVLKQLGNVMDLRLLDVSDSDVRDGDLALLIPLSTLQELDLSSTDVSDQGVASLSKIESLRHVDLRKTHVTESGIDELRRRRPEMLVRSDMH